MIWAFPSICSSKYRSIYPPFDWFRQIVFMELWGLRQLQLKSQESLFTSPAAGGSNQSGLSRIAVAFVLAGLKQISSPNKA